MSLKITIHAAGTGRCSWSKKDTEGFLVTFEDGTFVNKFFGPKALMQLVGLKVPDMTAEAKPPAANGVAPKAVTT